MSKVKVAASSRTNQAAIVGVVTAIAVSLARHHGVDVRAIVEGVTGLPLEDVMAIGAAAVGSVVVWARERGRVRDQQDSVTPRP